MMADVAFVVETSSFTDYNTLHTYVVGLVKSIVGNLDVDTGRTRIAVVTYGSGVKVEFYLNSFSRTVDILSALDNIQYGGYDTNMASALDVLLDVFTVGHGARFNETVQRVAVIIAENPSTSLLDTLEKARQVRHAGIGLVTVGIGTSVDKYELSAVASYPYTANMFYVSTMRNVSLIGDKVKRIICEDDTSSACINNLCNGGTCSISMNQVTCDCPAGKGGERCEFGCNHGADIAILLDTSGSIGEANFMAMTQFVSTIIEDLDIDSSINGPTLSRVALITFGDTAVIQFYLDTYRYKDDLLQAVNVKYVGGQTNTELALHRAMTEVFSEASGDRPSVPNYIVVITDGMSDNTTATWNEARAARAQGINIIAVGIGNLVNLAELQRIASAPDYANVLLAEDFTHLTPDIKDQISTALCNNVNDCASNPCQNGATCTDSMNGYTCSPCPDGTFTGFSCDRHCSGVIDLTFVLQSSGTVHAERWHYVTDFVSDVIGQLDVGPDMTRVAVIYYSDSAYVGFQLDQYYTRQDLVQALDLLPYIGNRTNVSSALSLLRQVVFQPAAGDRPSARNIAVVVSNGPSTVGAESVASLAAQLRADGTLMIVVGADQAIGSNELASIVSEPVDRNVLYTPTLSSVANVTTQLVAALCNDVNECASNPCQNGGTCVDDYGFYYCLCPETYAGHDCDRRCNQTLDVIFVLDISTSVQDKYQLNIDFASAVADDLDIYSGRVRVGAVAFATQILGQFYLSDHTGDRQAVVSSFRFYNPGGTTNAAVALQAVSTDLLSAQHGARDGVHKAIFLISDGFFMVNVNQTYVLADQLKASNPLLSIYSVAVGSYPDLEAMQRVSSSEAGTSDHVFLLPTHDDVVQTSRQLVDELCAGST